MNSDWNRRLKNDGIFVTHCTILNSLHKHAIHLRRPTVGTGLRSGHWLVFGFFSHKFASNVNKGLESWKCQFRVVLLLRTPEGFRVDSLVNGNCLITIISVLTWSIMFNFCKQVDLDLSHQIKITHIKYQAI